MLDQHLLCRVRVAELERGIQLTGWFHRSFFSSASIASSSVVMPFVFDAAMKSVFSSTFSGLPSSFTPKPPSNTTLPPSTSASEAPGTPSFCIDVWRNSFICAIR
jgi:hypothetical protein